MHHPLETQYHKRCTQRDKGDVAEDLRQVFRTGDRNYTVEQAWDEWQRFCAKWGKYYKNIRKRGEDASYKAYFTYLNYDTASSP